MPIPKKTKDGEEKQQEEEELAAFLGRIVSDADHEEEAEVGRTGSHFDFGHLHRPDPSNNIKLEEGPPRSIDMGADDDNNGIPQPEAMVPYDDVFKYDSQEGNLFYAPEKTTFSFDVYKTPTEATVENETTTIEAVRAEEQDDRQGIKQLPSGQSGAIDDKEPLVHEQTTNIEPEAKASIVESKKSPGTIEWMEKFKKIGMKSEEQVTTIDDDGLIVQQGPPPKPFNYSFKQEKGIDKEEEDFFAQDQQMVDEDDQPHSVESERPDVNEKAEGDSVGIIVEEESVTEEEIVEESFHSHIEPVASDLLAVLAFAEDPPGQGDVEVMEFEDVEEERQNDQDDQDEIVEDDQNEIVEYDPYENVEFDPYEIEEEDQDETDSSVDAGPIPEEVKMERDDLSSAYDPAGEYDASESSDEGEKEETDKDEYDEEIVEEEIINETTESDSRGIEEALMVTAAEDWGCYEEEEDKTLSDVENQSQDVFAALEKAPEGKVAQVQPGYIAPDPTKKADSRSWTIYIILLALLLVAGVIAVLIILSQKDRENLRSSIVPIETFAPSQQPTVTPIPTSLPTRSLNLKPTTIPLPTQVPSSSSTRLPSETSAPTTTLISSTPSPTSQIITAFPTVSSIEPNQPIENDTCDSAIGPIVSDGTFNFGTIAGATIDDVGQCGDAVDSGPGVWYYVLGTGGEMLAHTCQDTSFDSKITVFGAFCDKLICVEANDNFCGEAGTQSAVSWFSNYREPYRILLSGEPNFTDGSFNLVLEARSNDECSTAIGPLSAGNQIPVMGNTLVATPNAITCDGVTNESPSVWYLVAGTGSQMTANVCDDTDFLARIRILSGSCTGLECIAISGIIDCSVSWDSVAFQDYYILISGQSDDDVGSFSLTLTTTEPVINDECRNALGPISIDGDPIIGSTSSASSDLTAPICPTAATANGVWYFLEGNGSSLQASLCDSANFDTRLSVYEGDCSDGDLSSLLCVGGNDDFCGAQSLVTFEALAGLRYYILVHGYGNSSGNFILSVTLL
jgi:hypothetical protein